MPRRGMKKIDGVWQHVDQMLTGRSHEETEAETADPKPDVAPKRAARRGGSQRRVIDELVTLGNGALLALPWTRPDALNEQECDLLGNGLDQAQMVSPTLRSWLLGASKVGGWGALIAAAVIISVPRMQRHGWLPSGPALSPEEQAAMRAYLAQIQRQQAEQAAAAKPAAREKPVRNGEPASASSPYAPSVERNGVLVGSTPSAGFTPYTQELFEE